MAGPTIQVLQYKYANFIELFYNISMETKSSPKPIALSLFSGAGGMDLGVAQAGFEILACIEKDPYCCETLHHAVEAENSTTNVIEADIKSIEPENLMKEMGLKQGELDLLFGGPPCQPFSQIGKKQGLEDERGLLLFQMTRFAKTFQPKVVFIEQVKGLLSAKGQKEEPGAIFQLLLTKLETLGYVPKWKLINAADYGVPQLRERVFIVATKAFNGFKFPEPTHIPKIQLSLLDNLKPYSTVGEALAGLGSPELKNGAGYQRADSHVDPTPDGDRFRIHGVPEGSYLAAQTHLPKEQIKGLTKKDTTKFLRVSRFQLSKTLRGGEIFFHPLEDRYLTPREYMRIHGFPDSYLLKGPIRGRSGRVRNLDQYRQVANAVPPPVAKILAQEIKRILLCQKSLSSSVTP
jgi:DNA (cytosine-5)-methyltransferase 1